VVLKLGEGARLFEEAVEAEAEVLLVLRRARLDVDLAGAVDGEVLREVLLDGDGDFQDFVKGEVGHPESARTEDAPDPELAVEKRLRGQGHGRAFLVVSKNLVPLHRGGEEEGWEGENDGGRACRRRGDAHS